MYIYSTKVMRPTQITPYDSQLQIRLYMPIHRILVPLEYQDRRGQVLHTSQKILV